MASIYLKKTLWEYKFNKLSHLILALKYYAQIYFSIVKCKLIYPKSKVIGILLAEHFGDIIASEPILPALLQKYPGSKIFWIIKPSFKAVLEHHPLIHQVIEEKNLLTSIFLTIANPFDYFYNLHLNELRKDAFFNWKLKNTKALELNLLKENYLINHNLLEVYSQLADLGKIQEHPNIYLNREAFKNPFQEPYWVINHKSNNHLKEWPKENWEKVMQLAMDNFDVKVIELGLEDALCITHPNFLSLVGKTSLEQSMKIIQGASFYLGVDTGPSHCANAFQISSLIRLGDFVNFRNYQVFSGAFQNGQIAKLFYNQHGPASELPIEEVWNELSKIYLKQQNLELSPSHNL